MIQALIAPALPTIEREFHASPSSASWVVTAFLLSAAVSTPIIGRLGDIYGKTRVLIGVMALLCVSTSLAAAAQSLPLLIAARALQGTSAGVVPLTFGIIRDEFPPRRVAGGFGMLAALSSVGGGAGVVFTGPIVDRFSLQALFWLTLVPLVLTTVAVKRVVPPSPVKSLGHVNWAAATLLSVGLTAALVGVTRAPIWGWLDIRTFACFCAGALFFALWVYVELRSSMPLIDMRLLRIRGVWTANLAGLLLGIGIYTQFVLIPAFAGAPREVSHGFAASITGVGLFLVPIPIAVLAVGSQAGRLEHRFGSKPPLLVGTALCAASYGILAIARDHSWELYVAVAVLGVGIGLALAAMVNLVVNCVPHEQTALTAGMNGVVRSIGGAFGGAMSATILTASRGPAGVPSSHGYSLAFAACAIGLLAAFIFSFAIPAGQR